MKSVTQLLQENEALRSELELLREENVKLKANQPEYFDRDGLDERWYFRREIKPEGHR